MKIIFPSPAGGIGVLAVNTEKFPDQKEAAKSILPKGVPFKLINETDFPADDMFFDAWEYNFANNDGLGEKE